MRSIPSDICTSIMPLHCINHLFELCQSVSCGHAGTQPENPVAAASAGPAEPAEPGSPATFNTAAPAAQKPGSQGTAPSLATSISQAPAGQSPPAAPGTSRNGGITSIFMDSLRGLLPGRASPQPAEAGRAGQATAAALQQSPGPASSPQKAAPTTAAQPPARPESSVAQVLSQPSAPVGRKDQVPTPTAAPGLHAGNGSLQQALLPAAQQADRSGPPVPPPPPGNPPSSA